MSDEPLTPIQRLRLAFALSEGHEDREFDCEPEYIEALLKEYDALAEAGRRVLAGLNARIEDAVGRKVPVPVFDGIADLHDALGRVS